MVQRTAEITWQGEARDLGMDFTVLRKIDARLTGDRDRPGSLLAVAYAVHNGGESYMDQVIVWSMALKAAGLDVSEDDCWQALTRVSTQTADETTLADYVAFVGWITQAVLPTVDLGKNPDAPLQSPTKRGRRKSGSNGTGSTSARAAG